MVCTLDVVLAQPYPVVPTWGLTWQTACSIVDLTGQAARRYKPWLFQGQTEFFRKDIIRLELAVRFVRLSQNRRLHNVRRFTALESEQGGRAEIVRSFVRHERTNERMNCDSITVYQGLQLLYPDAFPLEGVRSFVQ